MKENLSRLLEVKDRDHVLGSFDAPVTLIEYADFQCPHCRAADVVVDQLLSVYQEDLQYVFRHFPREDIHESAWEAAQASEAASLQGKFWEMHDAIFTNQENLEPQDLERFAAELDLDEDRFLAELDSGHVIERVAADVQAGEQLKIDRTPSFFINGARYVGPVTFDAMSEEIHKHLSHRRKAA